MLPLAGLKVVEFEGIGPGPLAGMILAQHGARVTVVRRPQANGLKAQLGGDGFSMMDGCKQVVALDLKTPGGVDRALDLLADADALIEGNRPGVMEKLGLGPQTSLARNARLVYGRMTGWGQDGPLSHAAGHDLNYVALSGVLSLAGREGQAPRVPPTMLGDASGALGLAFGIVAGVLQARQTGRGAVVDAAIVDITTMLSGLALGLHAAGLLGGSAPSMFHDSPFYDTYVCADGSYITIGALEPQFYALLLRQLGLADVDPTCQYDCAQWPALKARLRQLFAGESRAHWCRLLEGSDACFAPVLTLSEAAEHPHLRSRGTLQMRQGVLVAAPAPRFTDAAPCVV